MSGDVLSTGGDPRCHVLGVLNRAADSCGWLGVEGIESLAGFLVGTDGERHERKPGTMANPPDLDWGESPLGEVVFGDGRHDPRRMEWCEVSKPWGFGTMAGLREIGVTPDHRQNPGRMGAEEVRHILAAVCARADQAGDLDGFDRWLEGRIRRPSPWFVGTSEEAEYEALVEQAEACLGAEGLRRLVEYARLLTLDPELVRDGADPEQLGAVREGVITDRYRAVSPAVR